jgi:hypothetical protein
MVFNKRNQNQFFFYRADFFFPFALQKKANFSSLFRIRVLLQASIEKKKRLAFFGSEKKCTKHSI